MSLLINFYKANLAMFLNFGRAESSELLILSQIDGKSFGLGQLVTLIGTIDRLKVYLLLKCFVSFATNLPLYLIFL